MTETPMPVELGWIAAANTGWGLFGLHLALGLARHGHRVHLPGANPTDIPATLIPSVAKMFERPDPDERLIRFDTYGNHWPAFEELPNRFRVLLAVFEDSAIPETAIDHLKRYDLILAPSRWAQAQLAMRGIESTLWHQGYDDGVFVPAPRRRPANGPLYVFSGGKLEFRKGQDIVVEAFRRFRETDEGKDAVLVTAWQNRWPQTMVGIWESGYVKGIPVTRSTAKGPLQDIGSWLEANGIPREAHIDLGMPSQAELANAIRECDVGLFPNRCEGATNMVLPEVMGCGIPCIVSQNTGHCDVPAVWSLRKQSPITLPCPIFNGFDGWGETDPEDCVQALCALKDHRLALPDAAPFFGWHAQAAEIHRLITEATRG